MSTKSIKPIFELGNKAYIAILTICFTLIILAACSLAIYTIYQVTKHQAVNSKSTTQPTIKYSHIYNISAILSPNALRNRGVPEKVIQQKRDKCFSYVKQYKELAKEEERLYKIPTSITLAQGLLESDAGESKLAKQNNNHFGIKCFSKNCKGGHCSNYSDDSHKDFFMKYASVAASYRGHSLLLLKPGYKDLFMLDAGDFNGWARGLQRCGYATDKKYGKKLVQLVQAIIHI